MEPRMSRQINERDWKLFRAKLPGWQEAYMDRLNKEYIELLTGPGLASDKFWELEKRIRQDKKASGVIIHMSRTYMDLNILSLIAEGVIGLDDLEGFSEDLRERMALFMRDRG